MRRLEENHTNNYEDTLAFMAVGAPTAPEEYPSPEAAATAEAAAAGAVDYPKFDSLAALEAHAPGLIEAQATGDTHVTDLTDDARKAVWMAAKNDNHIVATHTLIGGYGGGAVQTSIEARNDVVPWQLPKGDKTQIQLQAGEKAADPGGGRGMALFDTSLSPTLSTF